MSTADPAVHFQPLQPPAKSRKPLSCISCKVRKLKCDHQRPACTRCARNGGECIYPEARRKPTFNRSNVKQLAARLAQVEGYLKEAGKSGLEVGKSHDHPDLDSEDGSGYQRNAMATTEDDDTGLNEQITPSDSFLVQNDSFGQDGIVDSSAQESQLPFEIPGLDDQTAGTFSNDQLIDLGMSESLPPFEIIEELHNAFFSTHYHYMPAIHSGRYFKDFYGSPLKKPPMCLQYAIWAMGALWHPKYDRIAHVFYNRARYYAETDEMKGDGEHFITIPHAQAWALITGYEARAMLYTRASMSGARCCRLVQMLALDKLDSSDDDFPATLPPPNDWIELEERRRVFWVAFSLDAQGRIATGWSSLIHAEDIMTRLPASEEAFASGQEEDTPFLEEALKGASYGGFSGSLILNHILKSIMSHVHLIKPSDQPEDAINGAFWRRHRHIDNQLSCLFMFMPDRFRLPDNMRDPLATYINLNFHASVICLHHVALEVIEKHNLDAPLRKDSLYLLKNAVEEIVSIVKMTAHRTSLSSLFSNPLCAFSLYCATTVYVYLAKQDPSSGINPNDMSNLELLIKAMEAIGRIHSLTFAFLQQACLDIDKNGLSRNVKLPNLYQYRNLFGEPTSNIPLLARSPISRHTQMSSPLPGRLPLDKPLGQRRPMHMRMTRAVPLLTGVTASMSRMGITDSFRPALGAISRNLAPTNNIHKRKRQFSNYQPSEGSGGGLTGAAAFNGRAGDGDTTGNNDLYPSTANMVQNQDPIARPKDPMIDGDFLFPDKTDSPFPPLPLGRPVGSGLESSDSHAFHGAGQSALFDHNEASFQQYQNDTTIKEWQSVDDDMLAFLETTNFPMMPPM
ncbi:hypothetical protein V8C42DRAFT_333826 [Trichoderma barbatum]